MTGCIALILSGGSGNRFGAQTPKQYLPLGDRSVIRHAVDTFMDHPEIDAVRVVRRPQDITLYENAFRGVSILDPVDGGETRQESVLRGLESLANLAPTSVLIHDGARPFPNAELITRALEALNDHHAVIPALPVFDTIKQVAPDAKTIEKTLDRQKLWRAQTPQAFDYKSILAAHRDSAGMELTDDAMVAEHAGIPVAIVDGNEDNIKITTQEDMQQARKMLDLGSIVTRVGTGFDVHQFGPGDHAMLCGIKVPHDHGLEGHSDADAPMHALTDAVLGAIAAGDIGSHFPPSDEKWRGAASSKFLRHAAALVADVNGKIQNVDITIICERPKIGPYRDAMRQKLAEILEIPISAVSVKATTTEQLGFTGRSEGLAAQAMVSIALPAAAE
jgi:2-C-methyl-D-erythritol 4-phosphate cytidylyltransferase / 2-C-methyl-D-erythritol 2,4-cyclodiphosphate synthase